MCKGPRGQGKLCWLCNNNNNNASVFACWFLTFNAKTNLLLLILPASRASREKLQPWRDTFAKVSQKVAVLCSERKKGKLRQYVTKVLPGTTPRDVQRDGSPPDDSQCTLREQNTDRHKGANFNTQMQQVWGDNKATNVVCGNVGNERTDVLRTPPFFS